MPGRMTILAAAALLAAALPAASCGRSGTHAHWTRADLEGAAYLSENAADGTAELEDGAFSEPVAPGSAAMTGIRLGKSAFGDLDGDGEDDAAAVTIENPGGSGTFYYVHALRNDGGRPRAALPVFLGDRIRVEGVSIHDGAIVVALLDRPDDASYSQTPTVPVIRRFRLDAGALAELPAPGGGGG